MTTTAIDIQPLVRVKSVTLHRIRIPLIEPFRISNGSVADKDAVLVELTTKEGVVGWGEASPMSGSFYSGDTPDSVWQALADTLANDALVREINPLLFYEWLRDLQLSPFAKAGLEGAVWDAYARSINSPLFAVFGTRVRPVPSGVAIGIFDHVDELLERVQRFVAEGYRRVKIKIQPGWDIEPVSSVREKFPDVALMVDANAAYTIGDKELFRELDNFGLLMIEQPLPSAAHDEAAELQSFLRTPLCADESAESLASLASLVEKGSVRIVNIKVQRVGGLSEALQMLNACRAAGLECWVGTMPELGVASAQGLQLAVNEGFTFPTDIEASTRWYIDDVIEPKIEIDRNGLIHLPVGPGSGFEVNREKVERYSIGTERFEM